MAFSVFVGVQPIFTKPKVSAWGMLRSLIDNQVSILLSEGIPVNGTSGTFVGIAGKGTLVCDLHTGKWYSNTGTLASPAWTALF